MLGHHEVVSFHRGPITSPSRTLAIAVFDGAYLTEGR
jgi:hypothetical protein